MVVFETPADGVNVVSDTAAALVADAFCRGLRFFAVSYDPLLPPWRGASTDPTTPRFAGPLRQRLRAVSKFRISAARIRRGEWAEHLRDGREPSRDQRAVGVAGEQEMNVCWLCLRFGVTVGRVLRPGGIQR